MSGLFIALEGIDGAGTTTQASRLAARMRARGLDPLVTFEPSAGVIGSWIRAVLHGQAAADPATVALAFATDRLDHVAREIEPARRAGRPVVSDRYVMSSLAYQAIECPAEWVRAINRFAPPADVTLLVRVRAEVAAERRRAGGRPEERFDALEMQRGVVEAYDRLAAEDGATVIDGERSEAEVEAELWNVIESRLG